jgi:ribosome-associated protein
MTEYSHEAETSKTQRKREADELAEKALTLMDLKPHEQQRLPLNAAHRAALDEATRIRQPDARRRHAHHLARLLQDEEGEAVVSALDNLRDPVRQQRLKHWMEQLCELTDARESAPVMEAILSVYPEADRQHLRNLIRNLVKQNPGADAPPGEKFKRERKRLTQYLNELERQAPIY